MRVHAVYVLVLWGSIVTVFGCLLLLMLLVLFYFVLANIVVPESCDPPHVPFVLWDSIVLNGNAHLV